MLSDEEREALEILKSFEPDDLVECAIYLQALEKITDLIEKQQKEIEEIEELKEENKKYIVQLTDEQYRKLVDIIRDKTSKEWNDKIKAKIEEIDYKMIAHQDVREAVKQVLQSLLEKE